MEMVGKTPFTEKNTEGLATLSEKGTRKQRRLLRSYHIELTCHEVKT